MPRSFSGKDRGVLGDVVAEVVGTVVVGTVVAANDGVRARAADVATRYARYAMMIAATAAAITRRGPGRPIAAQRVSATSAFHVAVAP
jgi:hypothetical protein